MYAVIHTGGKQYRVEKGERLEVERLAGDEGSELELTPVLLVDGDTVLASRSQLAGATVKVKLVGETRGPKITGFTYKPKSNQRRHYGHRQDLSIIEVTGITAETKRSRARTSGTAERSRPDEEGRSKSSSSSKAKAEASPADATSTDATEEDA